MASEGESMTMIPVRSPLILVLKAFPWSSRISRGVLGDGAARRDTIEALTEQSASSAGLARIDPWICMRRTEVRVRLGLGSRPEGISHQIGIFVETVRRRRGRGRTHAACTGVQAAERDVWGARGARV